MNTPLFVPLGLGLDVVMFALIEDFCSLEPSLVADAGIHSGSSNYLKIEIIYI